MVRCGSADRPTSISYRLTRAVTSARAANALSSVRTFKPSVRAVVMDAPLGPDHLHSLLAQLRCESYYTLPS